MTAPLATAAADAVEENAKLRAERDEAQRIAAQLRTETGERIYRLEKALVEALKEHDEAQKQVAELKAERDSATPGTLGIVISTLRAERDAAQNAVIEQSRINNIWRQRADRAEADATRANQLMMNEQNCRMDAQRERDALRQFAREIMYAWPDGGIEDSEPQKSAVRCGLLIEVKRDQWCGDNCACAEFHDWDDDALPVTCLRKAAWLNKDAP